MGLKTSPAAYQRMVARCLDEVGAEPYIDDILAGTPPEHPDQRAIDDIALERHYHYLRELFTCFRKYKLSVKLEKMFMFMTRIKFCGHILKDGTRAPSPDKTAAIARWMPEHIRTCLLYTSPSQRD